MSVDGNLTVRFCTLFSSKLWEWGPQFAMIKFRDSFWPLQDTNDLHICDLISYTTMQRAMTIYMNHLYIYMCVCASRPVREWNKNTWLCDLMPLIYIYIYNIYIYMYNLFEPPPKVSLMNSTRFFNQLKADQYRHLSRCNQVACTGNLGSLV